MNRRAVLLTVLLFALVVAGMFAFAFLKHDDAKQGDTMSDTNAADSRYTNITRVDGKHFFIDGVHTVVGEIPMPTPCDLLESDARVAESAPEQVTIDFTVVNNAEFCAEQITPQRFKVSANASENASFSATFEGRPIELNLVEAGPDESPDDFELFIKG
jgi:hypothetical protein